MTKGYDFYDEEAVFDYYIDRRKRPDNPNDTIEEPAFMEVVEDFRDLDILDLGCGDGRFGMQLLAEGCASYVGVEGSQRMVEIAEKRLSTVDSTVHHASIETWDYPANTFDLVISRLVLHYIEDISHILEQVHQSLKANGRFIFSIEHPVLTSSNEVASGSGLRQSWIVDNYFAQGRRDVDWMGSSVVKYHRTIQEYFMRLQKAGFTIEHLREPDPKPENIADEALLTRRMRIPLFLLLGVQKND